MVGAIDAATLAGYLDAVFAGLPQKAALTPVPAIEVSGLGQRIVVDFDVPQANIRFGRPGIARRDPDYIAAMVVNHILGGGSFTSRLFQEVREKRGLTYSVYSTLTTADSSPSLIGATSTKNERAGEALAVIEAECVRLALEGPTEDELDKAKKFIIGSYALRFDTSTKIAGHLQQLQREGFDAGYLDRRNAEVAAVTLEDARRVAKRLIGDGRMLVAIVGRPEGLAETASRNPCADLRLTEAKRSKSVASGSDGGRSEIMGQIAKPPLGAASNSFRQELIRALITLTFVCREEKLIVEVDGATHSTPEEIAYDARRESFLRDLGHRILRVTNDDVFNNLDGVCVTIF